MHFNGNITLWFVVSCRTELKGLMEFWNSVWHQTTGSTCVRILQDNSSIYSIFLCRLIHVLSMLIIQYIVSIFSYNCNCIYADEVATQKINGMVFMLSGI